MIEVIFTTLVLGYLVNTYPIAIKPLVPWCILAIAGHATWISLQTHSIRHWLAGLMRRGGNMSWIAVFVLGGSLFSLYWYGIKKLLVRLDSKQHAASLPSRYPFVVGNPRQTLEIVMHFDDIPARDLNLRDLFEHDFTDRVHVQKSGGAVNITALDSTHKITEVPFYWVFEKDSNSKYLQFFLPYSDDALGMTKGLLSFYPSAEVAQISGNMEAGDAYHFDSRNCIFTRQIYVYSERSLEPDQLAELSKLYESQNVRLQFRSYAYLESKRAEQIIKQR